MNKYFKNLILCGEIDYLCLLCEEFFQNTADLEKHIRWEKHRKLLKQQDYLPKFRKDSVYQIGKIYYCEVCNYVSQTLDSMKAHITEESSHKTNKQNPQNVIKTGNKMIKRFGDVVTISKKVISKEEWLGVTSKFCWVCRMETAGRIEEHATTTSHLVNLIQTEVVEVDSEFYRKLDKDTAYCFECQKTIPFDKLRIHSSDHQKDRENKNQTNKLYNIDREKNMATCIECNETMELRFLNLHDHITMNHKDSMEELKEINKIFMIYDHGKQRADLKKYGKDNHIKLDEGGRKAYCFLCATCVSPHIINFKEHVSGARHKGNLELRGLIKTNKKPEKVYYTTKPYSYFLQDIVLLKGSVTAIINKEICIHVLSLMFLHLDIHSQGERKLKCYLCDELITFKDLAHYTVHKGDVLKTKVITTVPGEFIREIRPCLYHCGYCNSVYPSWRLMEKHLRSWVHQDSKRHWQQNLDDIIVQSLCSSRLEYDKFIESIDVLD